MEIVEDIMVDGKYKMIIKGMLASDDGTYRVVATNESGSVTSKAIVTVDGKFLLLFDQWECRQY